MCSYVDVLYKYIYIVFTAVGVALFPRSSNLIAVLVHAPTLAGVAVTLGWFVVAFVGTARNIGAWRQEAGSEKQKNKEKKRRKGNKVKERRHTKVKNVKFVEEKN